MKRMNSDISKKLRVVGYIRVSTQEQAEEGYSPKAQEDLIVNECQKYDYELVGFYRDLGISGKSIEARTGLKQMLEHSKKDIFDLVLVWKTSRMARNVHDLLEIVETLQYNDVKFKSISESYDTSTPEGKMMLTVLGTVAEFERNTIVENLKIGMNSRARQGYKNGGKVYGYRSEGTGKGSQLIIEPNEAEVVKMIFDMYVQGKGYKAIANYLNKLGYKTVKGNLFSINGVKEILSNPTYAGKIRYNRYVDYATKRRKGSNDKYILVEGRHEGIIDEQTWNKARAIQEARSNRYCIKSEGKFPLTGILKCPMCGAGMVAAMTVNKLKDGTKKRIRYYSCGNFKNKGSVACKANSIRADYAEEYVYQRIKETLINDKVLKLLVEKANKESKERILPLLQEEANLIAQMEHNKIKKEKVFELFEDGIIAKDVVASRLKTIEEESIRQNERLEEIRIKKEQSNLGEISYKRIHKMVNEFQELLDKANPEKRKLLLQMAIESITIENRKIKVMHMHFNQSFQGIMNACKDESGESSDEDSPIPFVFRVTI